MLPHNRSIKAFVEISMKVFNSSKLPLRLPFGPSIGTFYWSHRRGLCQSPLSA
ncbi:hypothetical protein BJY00DRAFT_286791 [Aspergillus carlsbadensis]|nr:hypothetical protein BJY00DRAFT_286791 [Aspergillus carlsbadensis]